MTEEQFDALVALIAAIAHEAAGAVVHQRPPASNRREAEDWARETFDLPRRDS
jgi:hypothetical protein